MMKALRTRIVAAFKPVVTLVPRVLAAILLVLLLSTSVAAAQSDDLRSPGTDELVPVNTTKVDNGDDHNDDNNSNGDGNGDDDGDGDGSAVTYLGVLEVDDELVGAEDVFPFIDGGADAFGLADVAVDDVEDLHGVDESDDNGDDAEDGRRDADEAAQGVDGGIDRSGSLEVVVHD